MWIASGLATIQEEFEDHPSLRTVTTVRWQVLDAPECKYGIQPKSGARFEDCPAEIPVTVAAIEKDAAGDVDLRDVGIKRLGFRKLFCGEVDDCRIVDPEDTVRGVRVAKLRVGQRIVWIRLDRLLQ